MENLRILSMNLGRRFVPIKDKGKREYITDFIKEEGYDIVMLQGNYINLGVDNYITVNNNKKVSLLCHDGLTGFDSEVGYKDVKSSIIYCNNFVLACINVNCKNANNMSDVFKVCDDYSRHDSEYYLSDRIVVGRFPREVDTNQFCDMFDLEDVSTLVGRDTHIKNNREMVNHFFISRNLEALSVHKLVGMTEVSGIGEAYPIEVTLKKVLK
mgnify:CR=1 FL=1